MSPTLSRALMASSYTVAPAPSSQIPSIHTSGSPIYTVLITVSLILLLVCALGMHFLIKCVLKCSRREDLEELQEERVSRERAAKHKGFVSKAELGMFPTVVYSTETASKLPWPASTLKEKDTQCPICLNDFKNGEKIRVLPQCNHEFHIKCVDAWLCDHPSCPTCRHDLTSQSA
eukprot:c15719_g1_i1 orf=595-1119(+)